MNFSFLEREIGRLIKRAQNEQSVIAKRRATLVKLNNQFNEARVADFEVMAKENIEEYLKKLADRQLSATLPFDPTEALQHFKKYADNAKAAALLMENALRLSDQSILNDREYLLSLKAIRDLLSTDIEAVNRKKINSFFENYSKFLKQDTINKIAAILRDIQTEMSNISENYITFGRDNIFSKIISNPDFNLQSLINSDRQQLRDFEISSGGTKISSIFHNIQTLGGGQRTGRNIDAYTFSPVLSQFDYSSLEGKFSIAQQFFSENLGINFRDVNHLKEKSSKLEAYSQISGDNKLSQAFISLIREMNRRDLNEEKQKERLTNLESFKSLKEESKKLKTILLLKLDAECIEMLRSHKIVQSGDKCFFVQSQETSPLILSDSAISAISPLATKTASNKNRYFRIKNMYDLLCK